MHGFLTLRIFPSLLWRGFDRAVFLPCARHRRCVLRIGVEDLLGLLAEPLRQISLDLVPLCVDGRHSPDKGPYAACKGLVFVGQALVAI